MNFNFSVNCVYRAVTEILCILSYFLMQGLILTKKILFWYVILLNEKYKSKKYYL